MIVSIEYRTLKRYTEKTITGRVIRNQSSNINNYEWKRNNQERIFWCVPNLCDEKSARKWNELKRNRNENQKKKNEISF